MAVSQAHPLEAFRTNQRRLRKAHPKPIAKEWYRPDEQGNHTAAHALALLGSRMIGIAHMEESKAGSIGEMSTNISDMTSTVFTACNEGRVLVRYGRVLPLNV
jgi:hypothetical protein